MEKAVVGHVVLELVIHQQGGSVGRKFHMRVLAAASPLFQRIEGTTSFFEAGAGIRKRHAKNG